MPQIIFTEPSDESKNFQTIQEFITRKRNEVVEGQNVGIDLNSNILKDLISSKCPTGCNITNNVENNVLNIKFEYPNKTYWEYKITIPEKWSTSSPNWEVVFETPH